MTVGHALASHATPLFLHLPPFSGWVGGCAQLHALTVADNPRTQPPASLSRPRMPPRVPPLASVPFPGFAPSLPTPNLPAQQGGPDLVAPVSTHWPRMLHHALPATPQVGEPNLAVIDNPSTGFGVLTPHVTPHGSTPLSAAM